MNKNDVIEELNKLKVELEKLQKEVKIDNVGVYNNKLDRWKERAIKIIKETISREECRKLNNKRLSVLTMGDPLGNFNRELKIYLDYISVLIDEININPDFILSKSNNDKYRNKSPLELVELLCISFHKVARQLRNRYNNRPTLEIEDEYDVQNLMHALLKIHFDDIRSEEWTESHAGKSSRMDFLLKKEKAVIETKKTRKNYTEEKIADDLIIDIERYKGHSHCRTLFCFIYDPEGRIGNPAGLKNDLELKSTKELQIKIIIEPK